MTSYQRVSRLGGVERQFAVIAALSCAYHHFRECTALHCTALEYRTVLYCPILYNIVLYCIMLCSTLLCFTLLYRTIVLLCTVMYRAL